MFNIELRLAWLLCLPMTIFNIYWNGIVVLTWHPMQTKIDFWSQRDQINDYESCRIEALTKKWEMIWNNTRLVKSSCAKLCIFAEQCEDKFGWSQVTGEVNVWRVSKRPWTSFNNLWSRMRLPSLGRMHFRDGWSLFCCEKMVRRNCDDRCLVVLTQSSYGFAMDSHVPIICSRNRDGLHMLKCPASVRSVKPCWMSCATVLKCFGLSSRQNEPSKRPRPGRLPQPFCRKHRKLLISTLQQIPSHASGDIAGADFRRSLVRRSLSVFHSNFHCFPFHILWHWSGWAWQGIPSPTRWRGRWLFADQLPWKQLVSMLLYHRSSRKSMAVTNFFFYQALHDCLGFRDRSDWAFWLQIWSYARLGLNEQPCSGYT